MVQQCSNSIWSPSTCISQKESNLSHLNPQTHTFFNTWLLQLIFGSIHSWSKPYRVLIGILFCKRSDISFNEEKASFGCCWEQLQKQKKTAYSLKWRQINQAGWLSTALICLKQQRNKLETQDFLKATGIIQVMLYFAGCYPATGNWKRYLKPQC